MFRKPAIARLTSAKLQASPASNMATPLSTKSSNRWSKSKTAKKIMSMKECTSIVDGLKIIYFTKVSPGSLQAVGQARKGNIISSQIADMSSKDLQRLSDDGDRESVQCRYGRWKKPTNLGTSSRLTSTRVTSMQNPLSSSSDNTRQV